MVWLLRRRWIIFWLNIWWKWMIFIFRSEFIVKNSYQTNAVVSCHWILTKLNLISHVYVDFLSKIDTHRTVTKQTIEKGMKNQPELLPNLNAVHGIFGYKIHPSSDTHIAQEKEWKIYLIQLKITCAYKLRWCYVQNFKKKLHLIGCHLIITQHTVMVLILLKLFRSHRFFCVQCSAIIIIISRGGFKMMSSQREHPLFDEKWTDYITCTVHDHTRAHILRSILMYMVKCTHAIEIPNTKHRHLHSP